MAGSKIDEQATYLRRLGLEAEPPSVEALCRLHRAHVERVPWETLWIQQGERWPSDVRASVQRIATTARGGYCFHLNGAFSALLGSLGYRVTLHVGGVHGPEGPSPADLTNHLVLMAHDLPTDGNPGGVWYVDVGLGDALYEPLPLRAGNYQQDPFELVLEPVDQGLGDWHLIHDESGSFTGMSWSATPTDIGSFTRRHEWLSTAPESGFVRNLVVQHHDASSVTVLRGLELRRIGPGASQAVLTSQDKFFDVLADTFGLDLSGLDVGRRAALWERVSAAQAEWEAHAGAPGD
jgi:N-hydroxyarylamine O-acetyltransferase